MPNIKPTINLAVNAIPKLEQWFVGVHIPLSEIGKASHQKLLLVQYILKEMLI
jgi:hypothetical protein